MRSVVDQARRATHGRQHHHVFARPVGIAMRGIRIFGKKAGALAGKLRAILGAPIEVARHGFIVSADEFGCFFQKTFGGKDFSDRFFVDIVRADPESGRGDGALGIGLQLDEYLARLVVRCRRVVKPRDHIRQRFAGHIRGEQPAADRIRHQVARDRRQHHFEFFRFETDAVVVHGFLQRGELGGARAHLRPRRLIKISQEAEFGVRQLLERHLDFIAEAQLLLQGCQPWEGIDHRVYIRSLDLKLHALSPLFIPAVLPELPAKPTDRATLRAPNNLPCHRRWGRFPRPRSLGYQTNKCGKFSCAA